MMKVSTIDGYGGRFNFEPPVETGAQKVQTLRDLAVVAFVGHQRQTLSFGRQRRM